MTPTPPEGPRTWVEFDDPDCPARRFRCDLTWLTSDYRCIFGRGCRGIETDRPSAGCCTLGGHFTDDDDVERVAQAVADLTPDDWQHHEWAHDDRWLDIEEDAPVAPDGSVDPAYLKTRVVDGACVLLNRDDFAAGPGCALHLRAVREHRPPHEVKPDVCWQLPIRRAYRDVESPDETSYQEVTIGEFTRAAWGPGGHDLDWFCTDALEAHTSPFPLYVGHADELRELMGAPAYDVLVDHCAAHLAAVDALTTAAAQGRPTGAGGPAGRRLLPLTVHPATVAARSAGRATRSIGR